MSQAVLSPNLTKKFQWEVSQIANNRFPCVMLLGGLSVNLNHLKRCQVVKKMSSCQKDVKCQKIKHLDYGGGSQKIKLTQ